MSKHGLFQKGVRPSAEMRRKMSEGLRRYHAKRQEAWLKPFLEQVQLELDKVDGQLKRRCLCHCNFGGQPMGLSLTQCKDGK